MKRSCRRSSTTRAQALLYLPKGLPDVRNAAFSARAADEIVRLLEISQGRAFCLFTSYSQMRDVYERVSGRVGFPAAAARHGAALDAARPVPLDS